MGVALQILRTMRPHQWVKNVFVLAPLVFSEHAGDPDELLRAGLAFLLFSALSGSVYLLNDIVDVEADREHPTKRDRPIASGQLPLATARLALGVLLTITIAAALAFSMELAAVGLAYFCLNVGYSFSLKHVPFVDVLVIATGFMLRLFGGGLAIDVPVSWWLGACTFLLAGFLGLGKRQHELELMASRPDTPSRKVLQRYQLEHIQLARRLLALATVACYSAYTLLGQTAASFAPRDLVWTIPFVIFGLWRFDRLTHETGQGRSPTDLMLRDVPFMMNVAAYGVTVLGIIYAG